MSICPSRPQGGGAFEGSIRTARTASLLKLLSRLTLLIALATALTAHANLPVGWSDTDNGSPTDAGSASYGNGAWADAGGGVSHYLDHYDCV